MSQNINVADPLIEVYKLETPEGPAYCPKWLRNLRPPSAIWQPNLLSGTGNRIVKVTLTALVGDDGRETGMKMVIPYVAAIPLTSNALMLNVVGLVLDPSGLRVGTAQISLDVYNKYQEMEIVSL